MPDMWTDQMLYDACHKTGSIEQAEAFDVLFNELYCITFYMVVTRSNYPDPESLAKDCAQGAIIKILKSLDTCQKPDSFRAWAKKIARNHTLNELIKRDTLHEVSREDEDYEQLKADSPLPQEEIEQREWTVKLMYELAKAQWSQRSKQVVLGKFLEDKKDTTLAEELSQSEGEAIRPSHIQVTRTKDLNKLRENDGLSALLRDLLD